MWRISGVIDFGLVNALVEMVPEMAIRLLSRTPVETVVLLSRSSALAAIKKRTEEGKIIRQDSGRSTFCVGADSKAGL